MANRFLSLVTAAGLALAAVACDSGPAASTAPNSIAVASFGATVQGTVGIGNGSSAMSDGVRALASVGGAKVSVVGRTESTTTDGSGRFTLRDVPTGQAELRFQGSGIDARLEIRDLAEGQTVTIEVQVEGQKATLARPDDHGSETSLRGRIDGLNGSELQVSGRRVVTDGSTRFLDRQNTPTTMGAFNVGGMVQVEGISRSDNSVLATKIKQEDGDDDAGEDAPGIEVNFVGSITTTSPLVVAGRTVMTDRSTRLLDRQNNPISMGAFKAGDMVEVEGTSLSGNSVLAKKIKQEDADDDAPGIEVNFVGSITSTSPLIVAGRTVMTDSSTRLLDRQNNPITMGAFKPGDKVEVEGSSLPGNNVLAKKIKRQD